ncbi:MAG: DNA polymerase III subunit chi [Rickettsiaceae bacterium]|nr:DNA polymerase III subunit chi [Rickettsiaceae bacterium]
MQINFYNTKKEFLTKSFCQLVEKGFADYKQTYVITNDLESVNMLDVVLWTYSRKKFLPHARIIDPLPQRQPILILSIAELNQDLYGNIILVNIGLEKLTSLLETFSKSSPIAEKISIINDETVAISQQMFADITRKFNLNISVCKFFKQLSSAGWVIEDKIL